MRKTPVTLKGNLIFGNAARSGGGVHLDQSYATMVNNVIVDNHASSTGSGVHVEGSSASMLHTTLARNAGGDGNGVYVTEYSDPFETYQASTVVLTNTILVSHSIGVSVTGGNTVTINGVLWFSAPITVSLSTTAAVSLQNQHNGNPAFAMDGYHLTADSMAVDEGVDSGVTIDIDGDTRPLGNGFDLGADEFIKQRVYLPLVLKIGP